MNTTDLRYFCTLFETGSFIEASRKENVTSSAISQSVKRLETYLDIQLVEHSKNKCIFTMSAKQLAAESKIILSSLLSLENKFKDKKTSIEKKAVTIALSQSLFSGQIKNILVRKMENEKSTEFTFQFGTSQQTIDLVDKGLADCGILLDTGQMAKHVFKKITTGKFVLAGNVSVRNPQKELKLLLSEARPETEMCLRELRKLGFMNISVALRANSWSVLRHFAEIGTGIALLPDFMIKKDGNLKHFDLFQTSPTYKVQVYFQQKTAGQVIASEICDAFKAE